MRFEEFLRRYKIDNIAEQSEFDKLMGCEVKYTNDIDLRYLRDTENGLWIFTYEDASKHWILTKVK